jgi:hypothetical protein
VPFEEHPGYIALNTAPAWRRGETMTISKRLLLPFMIGLLVIQTFAACDDDLECDSLKDCHLTTANGDKYGCCIDGECKFEAASCAAAAVETSPAPALRAEAGPMR